MSGRATLLIKVAISNLPEAEKLRVYECYSQLLAVMTTFDDAGVIAVALLGAELQDRLT